MGRAFDLPWSDALIGGDWVATGSRFVVVNPATGDMLAHVTDCGAGETVRAIDAAERAFCQWRTADSRERADFLKRWHALVMEYAEPLARLLTREQGKPLAEARSEIAYSASFLEWCAEEARRAYGETIPADRPGREYVVVQEPVGVVAAITPWNFPSAMIARKVAPAVAAGCAVVVKPAAETPLSALALARLAELADAPEGLINVVTSTDAPAIGRVLCADRRVRKLSFTGSTRVGKLLAAQCGGTVKRLSLELGGNAPFIVFEDADLGLAADALVASKFRNSGQTCVCANRIYIQDAVAGPFLDLVKQRMGSRLVVGNGMRGRTTQGPLISADAVSRVEKLVADAVAKGARLEIGSGVAEPGSLFVEPMLLTGVERGMAIAEEEIFGPVAAVATFADEREVIAKANGTSAGLSAYFFTQDLGRAWRVARSLESGMVVINDSTLSTPVGPFGGVKESGLGREGARYGLAEYLEPKLICFGGLV